MRTTGELLAEGRIDSLEKTAEFFEGIFREKCLVGKADLKEELGKVVNIWGWKGSVDELVDFWMTVGDDADPGMLEFVKRFKSNGGLVYMASDQEQYRARYLRDKFGDIFDGWFFSSEVGMRKKELGYFEKVFDQISDKADDKSEVLFVDDSEPNVLNAREFGIEAIHFRAMGDLDISSL